MPGSGSRDTGRRKRSSQTIRFTMHDRRFDGAGGRVVCGRWPDGTPPRRGRSRVRSWDASSSGPARLRIRACVPTAMMRMPAGSSSAGQPKSVPAFVARPTLRPIRSRPTAARCRRTGTGTRAAWNTTSPTGAAEARRIAARRTGVWRSASSRKTTPLLSGGSSFFPCAPAGCRGSPGHGDGPTAGTACGVTKTARAVPRTPASSSSADQLPLLEGDPARTGAAARRGDTGRGLDGGVPACCASPTSSSICATAA